MNDPKPINTYLQSSVLSATPEEIRLMLLDAALKFAHMAKDGMENNNPERVYEGFTNARNIVLELNESIKGGIDPELTQKVKEIFIFIYGELVHSSLEKDLPRLTKAIELLAYERETWALYLEERKKHLAQQAQTGTAPISASNAPQTHQSLSIQA